MLSSQTQENSAERRRHSRMQTRQSAELFLGAAQPNHVCMVLDRSSSGVQIDLGATLDLPETMIIQFSSEASQLVRRCWAAGTRAGMEFVGATIDADAGGTDRFDEAADPPPAPPSLAEIAAGVAASLQHIERAIRDLLALGQEETAVFFAEVGLRSGGKHCAKVTIIAPAAEPAALRLEAAINNTGPKPQTASAQTNAPKRLTLQTA